MICIKDMGDPVTDHWKFGGFGNRILYYNNLRQLAEREGETWYCVPWNGHKFFKGDMLNKQLKSFIFSDRCKKVTLLNPCLGEMFFEWSSISTRSVFELKKKPQVEKNSVAIHFRGTDFFQWNPDAVLGEDYYMNALSKIENDVDSFYIFTDDESLLSYKTVVEYLKKNNRKVIFGENIPNRTHYIHDFSIMSECDYIISSPSTYCICAGFIGKKKKIIHSKKWVEDRISKKDKFWIDLNDGGNDDYSIWKLI